MRENGQRTCFTLGKTPGAERILLWDDLEGLFKWQIVSGWGAARIAKRNDAAFGGNYGLKIMDRVRVPNGGHFGGAGRTFPMVRDGILRAECVAQIPAANGLYAFGIAVQWWDGVNKYDVQVLYENITHVFAWMRPNCSLGDTGLAKLPRANGAWHRPWMEIDLVRKEYVNVGIDADTVQLAGNKVCATADAGPVVAYVILFGWANLTAVKDVYFDNVLCYLV